MAVANTLIGKSLLKVGIGGATIGGGGWIIFSPTSPLWRPRGDFKSRALQLMKHVGFEEGWCTLDSSEKKYTCEKSKSKENLQKLNFFSHKKPGNNLRIFDDYADVEVEIIETKDEKVFPYGVKFVFKNTNDEIKIKETKEEEEDINSFKKKINPEFKAIWGAYKLRWAWEDINNLAGKNDFECKEKDSCTIKPNGFLQIRNKEGKKVVNATMDAGKKVKFSGNQDSSYFQGYKFCSDEDIELKGFGGMPLPAGTSITKFEKSKSYQITSDDKGEWYFIDV